MTTTEKPTTTGIVVDRNHKDGVSGAGKKWDRYSFQIASKDGKHWYTSFAADSWAALEQGKCYQVYYSEKPNPQGGAPFRNLEWWKEMPMDEPTAQEAQQAVAAAGSQDEYRRSKEEMRWTEAINNATNLLRAVVAEFKAETWHEDVKEALQYWAAWYYQAIISGPPQETPAEAPTLPAEASEEPEPPQRPAPAKQARQWKPGELWGRIQSGPLQQWNDDIDVGAREGKHLTLALVQQWANAKLDIDPMQLTVEQSIKVATAVANGEVA